MKHIVETDTVLVYEKPQYDERDKWVKQAGLKGGELIKEGTISLQSESHPVEFRKVQLFDLSKYMNKPATLNKVLATLSKRTLQYSNFSSRFPGAKIAQTVVPGVRPFAASFCTCKQSLPNFLYMK